MFRLIFLLLRYYAEQLQPEVEAFLILLLRVGAGDMDGEEPVKKEVAVSYQRVLSLEVLRGYVDLMRPNYQLTFQHLRRSIPSSKAV